jgi:MoxR-like ATPase
MDPRLVAHRCNSILDEVETVIVGKRSAAQLALATLLCRGHLLIEDIPGVGKTMLARSLAGSVGCSYKRIQFTPDLLPADVTGVSIYNQKTQEFEFRPGPIFACVVLADEINRATPKTQSALLECMAEYQVTVDGVTHRLPDTFFVIATQNPIEYHGTYPLPEAQLDRFLMRVTLGYPGPAEEVAVLDRQVKRHPIEAIKPVVSLEETAALQEAIKEVYLEASLKDYIVRLVTATRHHALVALGASPRGSLGIMRSAQAMAVMAGRDYVLPDDVKAVAVPVLDHRLILKPEARVQQARPADIVGEILASVPVPVVETR